MNKKTTNQRIESISLNKILAAPYQRSTDAKQISRIIGKFSEDKIGMPVVSERNGLFYIIDGNHRVAVLRRLGYESAVFIVLEGMTYEEEADYFRTQNENKRGLTLYARFKAGLEAGDETCHSINAIVECNGFIIGTTARRFDTLTAIYALFTVYDNYGEVILGKTLKPIRDIWDGNTSAKNREFIVGVAEFVHRFDVPNFAERVGRVNFNAIWQDYLMRSQFHNRATANGEVRKAFCRILVKYYNKTFSGNSKKKLSMKGAYED